MSHFILTYLLIGVCWELFIMLLLLVVRGREGFSKPTFFGIILETIAWPIMMSAIVITFVSLAIRAARHRA